MNVARRLKRMHLPVTPLAGAKDAPVAKSKRGVTPETAWLLAQALGTTPQFWINLQANFDLARNRPKKTVRRLRRAG